MLAGASRWERRHRLARRSRKCPYETYDRGEGHAPGWVPDWNGNAARTFFVPLFYGKTYGPGSTNYGGYQAERRHHPRVAGPVMLEVRDLRVSFDTNDGVLYAVRGLDLSVGRGRTVGIVGESGSGKACRCSP